MNKYILDGKTPVEEPDVLEWAKWYEESDRRVASTKLDDTGEEVSTVFLGLDHNWTGGPLPILFETMVFGGESDGLTRRCSTWEGAEAGHREVVEMLREREGKKSRGNDGQEI